ncbi:MAG: CDP-diacylglycerol--glycerol-3-phosphate 3-phosphatidyltransferase [Actinomycetota bacterium]|nr:MAG: CDP-diacylglycerol--glycerol-3-phosphate 3-phosphatidyltransferase [Actinomycetota bacterium]
MRPAPADHAGDAVADVPVLNLPNALTILRLALVPVFGWLLLSGGGGDDRQRVAAAIVFLVASLTDLADGALARRRHLVTTFGKIADPIADKALIGVALVGLSLLDWLPWWVTGVILAREVGVTVLRFWVIRHGVIPASRGGKAKTVVQMLAIWLYVLPLTGTWLTVAALVMAVGVVLTLATGIDYVVRAWRLRRVSRSRGPIREAQPLVDRRP